MNQANITISKIEVIPSNQGIFNTKPAKYVRVHNTKRGECLYIEGVDENGIGVHFWTPQIIINICKGMLNYESILKNTGGFFEEIKEGMVGCNSPFTGDAIMPMAIGVQVKIEPVIKIGQTIAIGFKSEEQKFNQRRLKIVRLVK